MKKSDRQNALAVAAVALCFMLTLGLTYFLGGEGFLAAFNQSEAEVKCYLLCGGAYESAELARSAAELVKSRGGAGYVLLGDSAEVVLSVYASEEEAESTLTLADVATRVAVCRARVDELRGNFATAAREFSDARSTELKLALVTAVALIDNISLSESAGAPRAASSLRYQCVQLVLCREALLSALNG